MAGRQGWAGLHLSLPYWDATNYLYCELLIVFSIVCCSHEINYGPLAPLFPSLGLLPLPLGLAYSPPAPFAREIWCWTTHRPPPPRGKVSEWPLDI
jgi:hypothetical protein